jgi:Co/Zn/Cd efflux system component
MHIYTLDNLHIWQVGQDACAVIISLVTHYPRPTEHYHKLLEPVHELKHVTIEVNVCADPPCLPLKETGT